jgi:hypothetical protein
MPPFTISYYFAQFFSFPSKETTSSECLMVYIDQAYPNIQHFYVPLIFANVLVVLEACKKHLPGVQAGALIN